MSLRFGTDGGEKRNLIQYRAPKRHAGKKDGSQGEPDSEGRQMIELLTDDKSDVFSKTLPATNTRDK